MKFLNSLDDRTTSRQNGSRRLRHRSHLNVLFSVARIVVASIAVRSIAIPMEAPSNDYGRRNTRMPISMLCTSDK